MGGMDLGFQRAGIKIVLETDNDPYCIETLCANGVSKTVLPADLFHVNGSTLLRETELNRGDVDVVFGGPSCQPFSRSNEGRRRGIKDPRGRLVFEFSRIVRELRPKAFVMENVRGLVSSNNGRDLQLLERRFRKMGYQVNSFVLNAADYGVPQSRHRLFIMGLDDGVTPVPPEPTHGPRDSPRNGLELHVTTDEAIGKMDDGINRNGVKTIGGMYGHLMDAIPPGMNYLYYTARYNRKKTLFRWRSKFWTFLLKMDPERPSHTIQATPGPYVGPFHWRNRRLTLDEVKKLQSIPAYWKVSHKSQPEYTSAAWRQVGNAVPPPLAAAVATSIKEYL
jgi:DNA (cytosine-5)-methyltransferase 1